MSDTTPATVPDTPIKIARILVYLEEHDLDYSPVAAAACHLASHLNAELLVVNTAYDERAEALEFLSRKECEAIKHKCLVEHREWLERARHGFHCTGVTIHSEVIWDKHGHNGIIRKAIDYGADLVIKHIPSHTPSKPTRLSALDRNILRLSPAPVLLVKKSFPGLYSRVLAAIDPLTREPLHERVHGEILDWANRLAAADQSELHSVSAYPNMNLAYLLEGALGDHDWREKAERHCRDRLTRLFEDRAVAPVGIHIREGGCDRVIVDLVDELHAGVLVLGSVARAGLLSLFVGNTVEKILDKVDCDILCLKPPAIGDRLRHPLPDTPINAEPGSA